MTWNENDGRARNKKNFAFLRLESKPEKYIISRSSLLHPQINKPLHYTPFKTAFPIHR